MGGKSTTTTNNTTSKKVLGESTTSNPFVTSKTNNNGTNSFFTEGSAFGTINDFFNDNVQNLLQSYLNPSLDSTTNKASLNAFQKNLNSMANQNLENNIINPLSQRNMIRSSQATDMYNNLQESLNDSIAEYSKELIANSQEGSAEMLNNLMNLYLNGFNAIASNQAQSLNTSQGNASQTSQTSTNATSKTTSSGGLDNLANVAMNVAGNVLSAGGSTLAKTLGDTLAKNIGKKF